MSVIAEIIAWIATLFRGAGMLAKGVNNVKYLVSAGNLFWMTNGIMMGNVPLIVSNGFCLAVMLYEIIKTQYGDVIYIWYGKFIFELCRICQEHYNYKICQIFLGFVDKFQLAEKYFDSLNPKY